MSAAVPLVRSYWGLIRRVADGRTALELTACEPSADDVQASLGVLMLTGMLRGDEPGMTLDIVGELPRQPRAEPFTAVSDSKGVATITFAPAFAVVPGVVPLAVPNVLAGPVKAELVAGTLTKTGCKVKVTTCALTTGAVTTLTGAAVTVIAFG